MKNIYILFLFVSLFANNVSSQESGDDLRTKLQFGLKFGTNYSNVFDTKGDFFNAEPKFGIITGIFLKVPFSKFLGFQPEILFSQKGFKSSGLFLGSEYKYARTSTYIDVPLFFSLKPCTLITLLAGPQYSYLILERDEFTKGSLTIDQQKEFKNKNSNKHLLGFIGGVEININHLIFGIRTGLNLTNNNGDGTATIPEYKDFWYQLTVGLKSYK